jgi:hypothetical protein
MGWLWWKQTPRTGPEIKIRLLRRLTVVVFEFFEQNLSPVVKEMDAAVM